MCVKIIISLGGTESQAAEGLGDRASGKTPLNLCNCTFEQIVALFGDHMGTSLEAVHLDELASRVLNENCEVVSDILLIFSMGRLTLASENFVLLLEIFKVFKESSSLLGSLTGSLVSELSQGTFRLQLNLLAVEHSVDASDNTASVVEYGGLLHVELVLNISRARLLVSHRVLSVEDDTEHGLGTHAEQLVLEAVDLAEAPGLGHAALGHVVKENLGVALKRRPVEFGIHGNVV